MIAGTLTAKSAMCQANATHVDEVIVPTAETCLYAQIVGMNGVKIALCLARSIANIAIKLFVRNVTPHQRSARTDASYAKAVKTLGAAVQSARIHFVWRAPILSGSALNVQRATVANQPVLVALNVVEPVVTFLASTARILIIVITTILTFVEIIIL